MDGKDSDLFRYFKNLLFKGFIELKKHIDCFLYIIKYMMVQPKLQCLQTFNEEEFKARFKQNLTDVDVPIIFKPAGEAKPTLSHPRVQRLFLSSLFFTSIRLISVSPNAACLHAHI